MEVVIDGVRYAPVSNRASNIGIAISSHNRQEVLSRSLDHQLKHLPAGALVVVIDDGSTIPVKVPEGVPYPQRTYTQTGLKAGQEFFYRARIVDRAGNASDWTAFIRGESSTDVDDIIGDIDEKIRESPAFNDLIEPINSNIDSVLQLALDSDATTEHLFQENGKNRADILTVKKTVADNEKAFAEKLELVQATVDGNTAAIQTKATTQFTAAGVGSATWSVNAGVTYNGQYYSAGMAIGVDVSAQGNVTSQVLFLADRFAVMSSANSNAYSVFLIENGQIFLRDAFIKNGSITSAKIGNAVIDTAHIKDGAITNLKISGDLQSDNFSATNGWQLSKARNTLTFNSASSGVFINTTGFGYQEGGVVLCKMGTKP